MKSYIPTVRLFFTLLKNGCNSSHPASGLAWQIVMLRVIAACEGAGVGLCTSQASSSAISSRTLALSDAAERGPASRPSCSSCARRERRERCTRDGRARPWRIPPDWYGATARWALPPACRPACRQCGWAGDPWVGRAFSSCPRATAARPAAREGIARMDREYPLLRCRRIVLSIVA
jgi:hypothetical protein